jgi:hypothetical protein
VGIEGGGKGCGSEIPPVETFWGPQNKNDLADGLIHVPGVVHGNAMESAIALLDVRDDELAGQVYNAGKGQQVGFYLPVAEGKMMKVTFTHLRRDDAKTLHTVCS